ncbi:MAG TPA: ion channel [Thermoanaerobaculia bacterium]|nr:ion channel [Thermoanaerobaculia bacterium]
MTEPVSPPVRGVSRSDSNADLGFGSVVAQQSRTRFLNRDGSFNVRREGLRFFESISLYHTLLTMTWGRFLTLFTLTYLLINALFAIAYVACGPAALAGIPHEMSVGRRTLEAFFFRVDTLVTIGYGNISPSSIAANVIVTVESLVGVLGIALVTGIIFARFARPTAQIIFSDRAVVAPYRGIEGFMFRIANQRSSQIVELEAKLLLTRWKPGTGRSEREFLQLRLERDRVSFFPLTWTIVHPIDEESPLRGLTQEQIRETEPEFLIMLSGFDETFSQTVHTRSSYRIDEILFGVRFKSLIRSSEGDSLRVNIREIHDIEIVQE